MLSLSLPLWVELIITLLIHLNITQIQENTLKKQRQGKSTSQQQMVALFVIMQSSCVQKYLHTQTAVIEKSNTRTAKVEVDPVGESTGSTNFLEDPLGVWPPVEGTAGCLASESSYAPMSNYKTAECLMLSTTINGHLIVDRWDSRLSRPSTSIFHCSLGGEHPTGRDSWGRGKKKQPGSFAV